MQIQKKEKSILDLAVMMTVIRGEGGHHHLLRCQEVFRALHIEPEMLIVFNPFYR